MRSSAKASYVTSLFAFPFHSLDPKPRRSGAMMRKRWVSERGRVKCVYMAEDIGQPWEKTKVGLIVWSEAVVEAWKGGGFVVGT